MRSPCDISLAALVAASAFLGLTWAALAATPAQADFIDHFARTDDIGPAKVPSLGRSRIVVLTMEVEGFEPLDMEAVRAFFANDPEATGVNFSNYYRRMSLGAYTPEVDVIDPIRFEGCPLPEDYFGFRNCRIPRNGIPDDGGTPNDALDSLEVGLALLEEIVRRADEEQGVDFSRYDLNGLDGDPDGWIDGVLLLHNINFGGIALPVFFLRREGPIEVDGIKINIVGIAESPLVALHEFGHLLGWADLYDESGQTQGYQYSAMGEWLYETDPPAMDAFSRAAAGWIEPRIVRTGETIEGLRLPPAGDSGEAVQLGEGEEYFLLENRGVVSGDYVDGDLEGRGLSIVHVNLREYPDGRDGTWPLRLLNCVNCTPWAPMLMNEQADGRFSLQSRNGRRNDREDLFLPGDEFLPNTINFLPLTPDNKAFSSNRYDGSVTGVSVTKVRLDGEDILVDVKIEEPCSIIACNRGKICAEDRCVADPDAAPEPEPEPEPVVEPEPVPAPAAPKEGCAVPVGGQGGAGGLLVLLVVGLVQRSWSWGRRPRGERR